VLKNMPLDLAILTTWDLVLFGLSFAVLFGLLLLLLQRHSGLLRQHREKPAYFGGVMLIGVMSLFSYFSLDDPRLRVGLLAAAFLVLVIGIIDEQVRLSPGKQLLWQAIIALVAVCWGWTITEISNPWQGGVIDLTWFDISILAFPGSILGVLWLIFLMNAINWLDGVDGLASGVSMVALLTLAAVSLLPSIQDALSLQLALIGGGAVLGFLLWNFAPAKVYLGTTGSWFLGLYIGFVAILGGGKIVTTLLVLALPVIDVALVIASRLWAGERPWRGDFRHFHHRLLTARLSPRLIAVTGMVVTTGLGLAAITLQTEQKIVAFITAAIAMVVGLVIIAKQSRITNI
jgi:UDP-GlcNAc:undecaprenyl-phosphate GlcNAc-1-phosphate transferase